MRQILAIFAKDARRFWPEILVCVALLIGLLLVYPATWSLSGSSVESVNARFLGAEGPIGLLAGCLVVLIPVGWLVLMVRVVHCERLVGDTQFWLTRPYDWRKLFAAKLLFLAAFLYVPFFAAQCVLLQEGGFHPFHYLGELLFNLLLLTSVGVLPLLALSTLTAGFGRLMLVLLGLALVMVAASVTANSIPSYFLGGLPDLMSGKLAVSAIFWGALAAALVMYARRRTQMGWLIVGALTVVLCGTAFFDPDRALVGHYYPELGDGSATPVSFGYAAKDLNQPRADETADKRAVDIAIPMSEAGVQDGYVAVPQALRVAMTDASGAHWESTWQGYAVAPFLPGESGTIVRFRMPLSLYDQFKSSPVSLRISVALTMARRSSESVIPLPAGDFAVPQLGVCKPESWIWKPDVITGISCRSAMHQPRLTYVTFPWTSGECKAGVDSNSQQMTGTAWAGELDPVPAELGITSVWDVPLNLSRPSVNQEGQSELWSLCPDTPIRFTQYQAETRLHEDVTIPGFRLPELAIGDRLMLALPQ